MRVQMQPLLLVAGAVDASDGAISVLKGQPTGEDEPFDEPINVTKRQAERQPVVVALVEPEHLAFDEPERVAQRESVAKPFGQPVAVPVSFAEHLAVDVADDQPDAESKRISFHEPER